jgi:hypothetical protein
MILPVRLHDRRFGKWSPNWEGSYRVVRVVLGNAYVAEALDGQPLPKALNGKYPKKLHPAYGNGLKS